MSDFRRTELLPVESGEEPEGGRQVERLYEPSEVEPAKPSVRSLEVDSDTNLPETSELDVARSEFADATDRVGLQSDVDSASADPKFVSTMDSTAQEPKPLTPVLASHKGFKDDLPEEKKSVASSGGKFASVVHSIKDTGFKSASSTRVAAFVVIIAILFSFFISFRGRKSQTFVPVNGLGHGVNDVKKLQVDVNRLLDEIEKLSKFSDHEPPSVTRIVFSDNDIAARKFIKSLMEDAGLIVREDAIGNIYGKWEGKRTDLGAVLTGSHTDAIPHAGKYDGVLGVLGAIEAIRTLKQSGFIPKRSIEVLMFTSEEPTRFGYGCLGSRLMSNQKGFKEKILSAKDKDNVSFSEAAAYAGYLYVAERLQSVVIPSSAYSSFVELHIEQGPFLERKGIQIGVVTHIAAPSTLNVVFRGDGGHAGGVLMNERNDAGLAGSELALAVESCVLKLGSNNTVGTTGSFKIFPGAVNSIPREAHLEIDIRDIDEKRKDRVVNAIMKSAKVIAKKRGVKLDEILLVNSDPPATASPLVRDAIQYSVKELKLSSMPIISRAYHDSLFISRIAPTGMIFIPCFKGYSHRPDEFASLADIENGVKVLSLTLAKLSLQ